MLENQPGVSFWGRDFLYDEAKPIQVQSTVPRAADNVEVTISNQFLILLCKICKQSKNIHFYETKTLLTVQQECTDFNRIHGHNILPVAEPVPVRKPGSSQSSKPATPMLGKTKIAEIPSVRGTVVDNRRWAGQIPTKCEICHDKLRHVFVDGKTSQGCWAIMCLKCHTHSGTGLGQKYLNRGKDMWFKVQG